MSSLRQLKKLKVLGEGAVGKVFLVKRDGAKYALKVEYIQPKFLKKGEELYNELEFTRDVASQYPDQFQQLYDHELVKGCSEKLSPIHANIRPALKQYLEKSRQAQICVYKLYSLVDTTLESLGSKCRRWSLAHIYSALLQILDMFQVMEKFEWVHGDFHPGNVGIRYTSRDYPLEIGGQPIKTHGTLLQLIDYGTLLNHRTLRSKHPFKGDKTHTEQQHYKIHSFVDKMVLFSPLMYDFADYRKFIQTREIKINFEENKKHFFQLSEYKQLRRQKRFKNLDDTTVFSILHLLEPQLVEQTVLEDQFERVHKPRLNVPIEDILYTYAHLSDTDKLIKYFVKRYKESL